jgi:inhibitor of cysteine peptidase
MRTTIRIIGLELAVLVLLVAACGGDASVRTLTDGDSGSVVNIDVGDRLEIGLEANPSTGYSWLVPEDLPGVEFVGETWTTDSDLVGSAGTATLTFEVVEPGTWVIELEYRRPWETGEPPERTFEVTISTP